LAYIAHRGGGGGCFMQWERELEDREGGALLQIISRLLERNEACFTCTIVHYLVNWTGYTA
jgi:hypothetical protein